MKKIVVADSSTLILLEKIGMLGHLAKTASVMIPEEVFREAVIKGKERESSDAYLIGKKVEEKSILVTKVRERKKVDLLLKEFGIGEGEAESIALFLQEKADVLATDDHKAITACKAYAVPFMTALAFVADACSKKMIGRDSAREAIKMLGQYGRYKDELLHKAMGIVEGTPWKK